MDKKLIMALNFVTLVIALVLGGCIYDYECFRCHGTVSILQFLDSNIYGLSIVIFVVIIAFFTKEEIPPKTQLTISFLSAILYFLTAIFVVLLYLKDYNTTRMLIAVVANALVMALHLTVGILYALNK